MYFGKNPFIDRHISDSIIERVFCLKNIHPYDLRWHRDEEDRSIYVIDGVDWKLQLENELPIDLKMHKTYFISKMVFHRIIMGNTDLKILIGTKGLTLPTEWDIMVSQ